MSEFEMDAFDAILERRLQSYSQVPVRPVDATAVVASAVSAPRPGVLGRLGFGRTAVVRPVFRSAALLVILGLILAIALAVAVASLNNNQLPRNTVLGDNGLIAFEVGELGIRDGSFHTINPDGTGELDFGSAKRSRFSTDGKSLVYIRHFEEFPLDSNLIVSEPDGTNERFVTKYAQIGFAFSPDGAEIAMAYEDETGFPGQIAAYSVADGSSRELLPAPAGYPDESRYVIDRGAWSPDGSHLAVTLAMSSPDDVDGAYRTVLLVVDALSLDSRIVSTRLGQSGSVAWSPDSRSIAYIAWADSVQGPAPTDQFGLPPREIYAVDIATGVETHVTDGAVSPEHPRWSPDGKSIAYISSASADPVVVVVDLDDAGQPSASRAGPVAHQAEWAPDASALVLSSTRFAEPFEGPSEADVGVLQIIDRDFARPPRTLVTIQGGVGAISWQRLDL